MKSRIIGREREAAFLDRALQSKEAEFLAIYGRRRVGKTYLVREHFQDKGTYLEIMGLQNGTLSQQLSLFTKANIRACS